MWGSPGTMLAAQVMYERTGRDRWLDAWNASADILWDAWRDELWLQDLYGKPAPLLRPGPRLRRNVLASPAAALLDHARPTKRSSGALCARSHATRTARTGSRQWPPCARAELPGGPDAVVPRRPGNRRLAARRSRPATTSSTSSCSPAAS